MIFVSRLCVRLAAYRYLVAGIYVPTTVLGHSSDDRQWFWNSCLIRYFSFLQQSTLVNFTDVLPIYSRKHIDQMMIKLSIACYAIRYVKHFLSQDTLRTIYLSYFHSIQSYGIIFWGNSAYSSNIFKIQKEDNLNNYECQK